MKKSTKTPKQFPTDKWEHSSSKSNILRPEEFSDASKSHYYCTKCGCELDKQLNWNGRYNLRSGKKEFELTTICYNKKHWWDNHTSEKAYRWDGGFTLGKLSIGIRSEGLALFDSKGNMV